MAKKLPPLPRPAQPQADSQPAASRLRDAAVVMATVIVLGVPTLFLIYGALAAALGAVVFLAIFVLFQLPIFLFLRYQTVVPKVSFGLPPEQPDKPQRVRVLPDVDRSESDDPDVSDS